MEYGGRSDPRIRDSRESAISVLMLAERASHAVCGNGKGYKLILEHFAGEASWYSFTPNEQHVLRQTIRAFRRELQRAGFIGPEGGEEL